MIKFYKTIFAIYCILISTNAFSATWEKLYTKSHTDCFRNVREVPAGGYIFAGYTASYSSNDTDAFVMRVDTDGDTLWTFQYNGPSSKEDCFYKVVPAADGGFLLGGYSRSFGNGDNAFYMKLNSSGVMQWVKNWGGSGIERVQDIVQLPDGKYVICGYTTTSPAQYYDAFILKIDANGNTVWNNHFGTTSYDDANAMELLPDGGFILGGQSNSQLYLIRTNSLGNSIWTKTFGTSGIDNIESITFAQGGDGFILSGSTTGAGAGGDDGYLIKTDTGGVQIWAKTFGGSLNDDLHRIEQTSDGGYIGSGTSTTGAWPDPNIWLIKFDVNGNSLWSKVFGGNHHDHGYGGQQTSDGGYLVGGHTRSYGEGEEDAIAIKTNSSGVVTTPLSYTSVLNLITPVTTTCGSANAQIQVEIANYGSVAVSNIPVTIEITGAITQTITQTYTSSLDREETDNMTFTTTVDMSGGGTFNFHCYTGSPHDVYPAMNYFDKSLTVGGTLPPTITNGSHCGPGTVVLSASSPTPVNWYSAPSGGSSLGTGSTFTTPYLFSNTTYYAQSGGSCQSARVPVNATIAAGLTNPSPTNGSRCGTGTVALSASSAYTIKWYSSATTLTSLATGTNYTTPSISSNTTYYIQAENATCSSTRVAITANILTPPGGPTTTPGTRCNTGTVVLGASSPHTIDWYDALSGGNFLGSGTSFTTPVISATTTFYASANNGSCSSNRSAAIATVSSPPPDPVASSNSRCGTGTVVISASAANPIKWFNAPSGGSQIGTGSSFTTPSISVTTTYYALADNGCVSNRIPVVATINNAPPVPVTTPGNRCGTGTVVLSATATAPVKWFTALTGGSQVGTGLSFTTPSISSTTTYYATADDGCPSTRVAAIATVNSIPPVPVTTPAARCSSGTVVLSATSPNTIEWFDAVTGGSMLGSGASFTTPFILTTTTFYASAKSGNCTSSRVPAVATVSSLPPDPVTTSNSRCGTGTVVLTASAANPIKWYNAPSGGSQVGTGSSFTTPSISTTTTYYALADNGCVGNRMPAVATINNAPPVPGTTPGNRCGPGTVVLSATSTAPVKWFTALTGGSQVGSGLSFTTPSISSTTTYYAAADDGCPSTRVAAVATINTIPAVPVTTSASRCSTGTVVLTATSSNSIEWYDAITGGNLVDNGSSFTTPVISVTTTYYALSKSGNCTSSRVPAIATVSSTPPDPLTTSNSRCGTGTIVLTASAANPIKWFNAPTGGSQVGTGSSFTTPSISTTTTYYALADNGCVGNRIPAVATINDLPPAPVTTDADRCGSGTLTLTATAADPVKWFTAATGGTQIGSGISYTTPVISTTTTYYAATDDGCQSNRIAAVATINLIPPAPTVTSAARCGSGTVTLSASASNPREWYDSLTGGNLVDNGSSFTTPVLNVTTTYYVLSNNGKCVSNRIPVVATISSTPPDPVTNPSDRCGSGTVTLTASASNPIKWFDAISGGNQIGSGSSITSPAISTTTTFYALADNACLSNRVPAIATVNTVPSDPVTNSSSQCGPGSLLLTATAIDSIEWYNSPSGGSPMGIGNNFSTPVISSTTTYYALADNGPCKSDRIPAVATINQLPADPVAPSVGRCGEGIVLLTATSGDSIVWFDALTGGNQLGTGSSFTTPFLNSSTTYYVQVYDSICTGNTIAVTATIHAIPTINLGADTIFSSSPLYVFDAGSGFISYLWSTTEITQTINTGAAGNYCVTVTDINNCTATDCVYLEFNVGINERINLNSFDLYPNPSDGFITIEGIENQTGIKLIIFDLTGSIVYFNSDIENKKTIDLSFLEPGVYFVRFNNDKSFITKKLIIE